MLEELNELAKEASKQAGETNKALEDLRRVNKLLADVRSELISSQKSLTELEERRKSIMSYMTSLIDAEIEVEKSELVEAKLDIQKSKSEHACLQLVLENKDLQLINARKNLGDEVNQEVAELKTLMSKSLRVKEIEVLAAQRALTIKDEELKIVLERLDTKEKELKNLKEAAVEDANDPWKLYSLARERIGERSTGNLAIKKLKQVEAATGDPQKLAETSRELLNKASLSIEANVDSSTSMKKGSDPDLVLLENNYVSRRLKQSHR
ncbi:hypothetical protein POTOM_056863 [Populus tomentosa]|uniref:Uncharacterized protein n=1 Tax=Populus tomentosa TaxID=118781 RepID=A0A8X7XXU7_POPTO|nr:hypothetical protein POTOM_056863 [Populus tomentosa]